MHILLVAGPRRRYIFLLHYFLLLSMVGFIFFWRYCTRLLDTHAVLSVMMRFFLCLATLNYIMWLLHSYLGQLTRYLLGYL